MRRMAGLCILASALAVPAAAQFGDGSNGASTISATGTFPAVSAGIDLLSSPSTGATQIVVSTSTFPNFEAGDEILVIKRINAASTGNVGTYEFASVTSVDSLGLNKYRLNLAAGLSRGYFAGGTRVYEVPNFTDLTIDAGVVSSEFLIACRVSGTATINGTLSANNGGFPGALSNAGLSGQSPTGLSTTGTAANGGGGGGGTSNVLPAGAGGGGHATAGESGEGTTVSGNPVAPGEGGGTYGSADLSAGLMMGSGGGSGGENNIHNLGGAGGDGGGIILLFANELVLNGTIRADGEAGSNGEGSVVDTRAGGGGGAGGTVWVVTANASGAGTISARGGVGGAAGTGAATTGAGGDGGDGRIRFDSPDGNAGSITLLGGSIHLGVVASADRWTEYE